MPIITGDDPAPGAVLSLVPAAAGLRVVAAAPAAVSNVPAPGAVVAWALVADDAVAGGARVDPVFPAGGKVWTPDQFRAAYGPSISITVAVVAV